MMGKLVVFGRVAVVIRSRDHNPPHFHIIGPEFEAQVGIDPLVVLRGVMTKAVWIQVQAWAGENRALLVAEWNRVNPPLLPVMEALMSDDMIHGADPRPIPRIAAVVAEPGHVLTVQWTNGGAVRVDLSGWIGLHHIAELRDEAVFRRPEVGEYGSCVQWMGNEDLAIDTIHLELLAEQQAEFGTAELIAWQERHEVSNQEAADLLGVAVNTWTNYRAGATRVPRGVAIACRAMDRDPLLFTAHFRPRHPGRPPVAQRL